MEPQRAPRHPRGLYVLCALAMWERFFSWHWYLPLLVLYVRERVFVPGRTPDIAGFEAVRGAFEAIHGPLTPEALTIRVYGVYNALLFTAVLVGGVLGDRLLGRRRSLFIGALVMAVGYGLLIREAWFFLALIALIVGNGALRSNIAPEIAALYPRDDPRLYRAFNTYYLALNIGMFASPVILGSIALSFGWRYAFAAAALGMLIGFGALAYGRRFLVAEVEPPAAVPIAQPIGRMLALAAFATLFFGFFIHQCNLVFDWAKWRASVPFPAHYLLQLPVNCVTLFIALPLLNLWLRKNSPKPTTRIAIGCFFLGIGLCVLALPLSAATVVLSTVILTLGEIHVGPVGVGLACRMAPPKWTSTFVATWLVSRDFICDYVAAFAGKLDAAFSTVGVALALALIAGVLGLGALRLSWRR